MTRYFQSYIFYENDEAVCDVQFDDNILNYRLSMYATVNTPKPLLDIMIFIMQWYADKNAPKDLLAALQKMCEVKLV